MSWSWRRYEYIHDLTTVINKEYYNFLLNICMQSIYLEVAHAV
jgi:hypothetical protein